MCTTRCICGKMQKSFIMSNQTHTSNHVFVFKTKVILQTVGNVDMKPVPFPNTELIVFCEPSHSFAQSISVLDKQTSSLDNNITFAFNKINVSAAKDWETLNMPTITLNEQPSVNL